MDGYQVDVAINCPSYHTPYIVLFYYFTSFPLPFGKPLQNYPSYTMPTALSFL